MYVIFSSCAISMKYFFCFFNSSTTTKIYTLSLHDALPISPFFALAFTNCGSCVSQRTWPFSRSEEHTSELQSQFHLVCRLLLEKKNTTRFPFPPNAITDIAYRTTQTALTYTHTPSDTISYR